MNKLKISAICSLIAALCFYMNYFVGCKSTTSLCLGSVWICISISLYSKIMKNNAVQ